MKKYPSTDILLLSIIIVVGGILRFYNYHHLPFSYDEFSALFRTRFDNFQDLIRFGVVTTDTHPAGIQVFLYYWVKLFGEGEGMVKLPFVLAGLGAIYLAYRIAASWFNSSVGLATAMVISFLQYTITYSQYARPYISGLFFVLLFIWSFQNAFINRPKNWKYHYLAYVLSGAASAYNHHFSLFFLGLAGISLLFVVPWKRMAWFIAANILIFLLYLPHLEIFFAQLNKGGVESWLRKPEPGFFLEYLSYLVHHSRIMFVAVAAIFLGSLFYIRHTVRKANSFRILMFLWVSVTWATAYYYSVYRSSVLQFSVLLFTFPFLVILFFSFLGDLKVFMKVAMVVVFGGLSVYTLVVDRQHYTVQYRSVLEQTIAETSRARLKYGDRHVACATNISPKVQDYYSREYRVDTSTIITFDSTTSFINFREALEQSGAEYLAIGWVNISDLEFFSVAREVFPVLVKKESYYTGDFYLLSRSRQPIDSVVPDDRVFSLRLDSLDIYLNAVTRGYPMLFEHNRLLQPGWMSFTNFYEGELGKLVESPLNYLSFTLEVENPRKDYESMLILEVVREDEVVYWTGRSFNEYTLSEWGRYRIHLAVKLADLPFDYQKDKVRVYLSNLDDAYYYLNYFRVETSVGNPLLYSLFQKIEE